MKATIVDLVSPHVLRVIELAEQGHPKFLRILADHVERGVIVSARASAAINAVAADVAA